MNTLFIQLGLLGFLRLATSTFVASWTSSPMSWSPDGEWLSYTVAAESAPDRFSLGYTFCPANDDPGSRGAQTRPSTGSDGSISYRIWATQASHQASVLIEESHWPLSAPAWSPRGKSIAFGRFMPQSSEPTHAVQRGRYEVVIQDGLDRKHVVWSSPELEWGADIRASLPHLICSWSPDGLYLAIPLPGRFPAVEIVRTDTKKRVHLIERAGLPSWSPDGTKCAFIRHEGGSDGVEYVERAGQSFSEPMVLASSGAVLATPHWSSDSRSIYAVMQKPTTGSLDLEIVRLVLEPREIIHLMPLAPADPARRRATIRGLALDFDEEGERCFFSVDVVGRDSALAWTVPRERVTHKRFHPLDVSQRIKAIAVSPNGQWVAARFDSEDGLTAPAIFDSETEQTTLLVPDEDTRKGWLRFLSATASRLLKTSLPAAVVDGQTACRPTLLPLPGELPPMETTVARLARLAPFGVALCSTQSSAPGSGVPPATIAFDAESRLFFYYLLGDYQAAAAALECLEPFISAPRERLGLLSVRAQILWLRGQKSEAQGVIDYLASCEEPNRLLVEDTPRGAVLTPVASPRQTWARYLSERIVDRIQPKLSTNADLPTDVIDPHPQEIPPMPEMPLLERGGGAIPFVPKVPGQQNR